MANLVQRFLRNQSCLRAIPRLNPNLTTNQKPCISNVESVSVESDPVPLTNPVITVADNSLHFYPSFPIGYGFNPIVIHDSGLIETVAEEKDEKETVIYADSVKKKRKKKMNKHKYRKLKKEMGRKS
uniref:Small ribosomal subunit protein mS38 n=1 Tax=Noccaea caerulescens TaxID=107243 RepID=A0A1J3E2S9_NOCCA